MDCPEVFRQFGLDFKKLDGSLESQDKKQLIDQMNRILAEPDAQRDNKIVYVWATPGWIPRLCGKSNIIYIGKTEQTLRGRYSNAIIRKEFTDWSVFRHIYIISKYGPIEFFLAPIDNPKGAEENFLRAYYKDHLESPPFNGSLPDLNGVF